MMQPDLQVLVQEIRQIAQEEILPRFAKIGFAVKQDGSLLTEADLATNRRIEAFLQQHWPHIAFLSEEMELDAQEQLLREADALWCLDPLDGTSNFAAGLPLFAVSLALFERGEVKTVQKAFDKYLADNKPAYVAIEALTMQHGIELIQACGGKAVLAHPTRYQLSATRVRKLIEEFAQLGGDACELPANSEPVSTRRMVDRSIAEHKLAASIGSDFHGSNMPWRRLGDVPNMHPEQQGIWQSFATLS